MESNTMPGGMYSGLGSGMLGLEMSLHHHIPKQNAQNPPHPMVAYAHHEGEIQQHQHPQAQLSSAKQSGYNPYATKSKNQSLTLSDDEEPGGLANENSADDGKRKMSPWQRMKWTDNMVRLLIMVVYYIGDEAGSEGNDPAGSGKKKVGGGVLQKKGKWKSVSRAMMERGFYVSPQQCEDKFNDLNKRYKRVNDILGKGTACSVVENQSLLDTMDHLSPKMKEEVKKLLNSKHLFFREMCAYHNSCGHGGAVSSTGAACAQQSPEVAATEPCHQGQQQSQQPRCLHSTENATNFGGGEVEGSKLVKGGRSREEEEEEEAFEDDDEDDDEEEEEEEDDDDDVVEGGGGGRGHEDDDDMEDRCGRKKKRRKGTFLSPLIQQLSSELSNVFQDETKSAFEKRQWMRTRLMQLEEQHVGYEYQAFEIEKQRLKWVKFSSKKEREMERDKLSNDRMKLENERMSLLIRQKEIELLDIYQQQQTTSRKSDPSSITG